jgi:hypothetical protein
LGLGRFVAAPKPRPMAWAGIGLPRCGEIAGELHKAVPMRDAQRPHHGDSVPTGQPYASLGQRPRKGESRITKPQRGGHNRQSRVNDSTTVGPPRWGFGQLFEPETQADGQGWHRIATLWRNRRSCSVQPVSRHFQVMASPAFPSQRDSPMSAWANGPGTYCLISQTSATCDPRPVSRCQRRFRIPSCVASRGITNSRGVTIRSESLFCDVISAARSM